MTKQSQAFSVALWLQILFRSLWGTVFLTVLQSLPEDLQGLCWNSSLLLLPRQLPENHFGEFLGKMFPVYPITSEQPLCLLLLPFSSPQQIWFHSSGIRKMSRLSPVSYSLTCKLPRISAISDTAVTWASSNQNVKKNFFLNVRLLR